jgi:hypothetical protein
MTPLCGPLAVEREGARRGGVVSRQQGCEVSGPDRAPIASGRLEGDFVKTEKKSPAGVASGGGIDSDSWCAARSGGKAPSFSWKGRAMEFYRAHSVRPDRPHCAHRATGGR